MDEDELKARIADVKTRVADIVSRMRALAASLPNLPTRAHPLAKYLATQASQMEVQGPALASQAWGQPEPRLVGPARGD